MSGKRILALALGFLITLLTMSITFDISLADNLVFLPVWLAVALPTFALGPRSVVAAAIGLGIGSAILFAANFVLTAYVLILILTPGLMVSSIASGLRWFMEDL